MKLIKISTFRTLMEFSGFLEQTFEWLLLSSGSSEAFLWIRRHNTVLSSLLFFSSLGVFSGSLGLCVFSLKRGSVSFFSEWFCSVGHFDLVYNRTFSNFSSKFCHWLLDVTAENQSFLRLYCPKK